MMPPKTIKYIAYFDTQDSAVRRNYVTSATNKVEYIAKTIASLGYQVEIHSVSEVIEEKIRIYSSEKKNISEGVTLHLPPSLGGRKRIFQKIKNLWHPLILFLYLLLCCGKKDTIVVYHSLGYFNSIILAKRIKKFKLILEVEEIYSDVSEMSAYWRNLEFKMFNIADAFILSNDLLDAEINAHGRPSVVVYGAYQVEPKRVERFDDGKIHAVYAGTFDPNKGGAQTAIMAAEYLPENYHIHICGFGTDKDVVEVQELIKKIQSASKVTISYDGLKKGEEFIRFLQQCHIGLSTQNPDGKYNSTSFPSKVLTYMANGLQVVSIRIPVLECSGVGDCISYYEKQTPEAIADSIARSYETNHISTEKVLQKLDKQFSDNLIHLIQ